MKPERDRRTYPDVPPDKREIERIKREFIAKATRRRGCKRN